MPAYQYFQRLCLLLFSLLALFSWSCSSKTDKKQSFTAQQPQTIDTVSLIIQYDGSLFPIPSPYQVAKLVKSHSIPFNHDAVNETNNAKRYSTIFKKALNFGVYGANLNYLNIYNRTPESITYLATLKQLSEELGISAAFSPELFRKIENNITNQDSLLKLLGSSYREIDGFLHDNDRKDVGALIIAGGWVESLYLLTTAAQSSANREIINRIGEQKHPLNNLIEVLSPYYYRTHEHTDFVDKLVDLAYEFDGIIYSYSYKEPKIDKENKITHINSQSRVIMSEYHLSIISQKIEVIRNSIIG